jgi:hypothetical protein
LSQANERQKTRDTALNEQLARLAKQKTVVKKPEEIDKALPEVLPLASPLTLLQGPSPAAMTAGDGSPEGPLAANAVHGQPEGKNSLPTVAPEPKVFLPVEDLKPLYDFAVDCKSCQARLAVAQADLEDERTKTAALRRERDSALQVARGGSVVRRIVRAAKRFAIGAAAGAVAVKLAR